jgi:hypothetical protein
LDLSTISLEDLAYIFLPVLVSDATVKLEVSASVPRADLEELLIVVLPWYDGDGIPANVVFVTSILETSVASASFLIVAEVEVISILLAFTSTNGVTTESFVLLFSSRVGVVIPTWLVEVIVSDSESIVTEGLSMLA